MVFFLVDLSHLPFFWRIIGRTMAFMGLIFRAQRFTNVSYDNGSGQTLHAYLAKPPGYDESQTYPTAVVFHAWNGMSREPVFFADKLAQQGYIAIAPDMFRGVASRSINIAWNVMTISNTPQSRINDDVDAALAYLQENVPGSSSSELFSGPGFCFGGSQALELAKRVSLTGTISLYGSYIDGLQDATDDDAWGILGTSPVLGIYGADDRAPTKGEALGFAAALEERGVDYNVTIYSGVGHAFVTPRRYKRDRPQARAAWNEVVSFMNGLVDQGSDRRQMESRFVETTGYAEGVPEGVMYVKEGHASHSMLWDHITDPLLRKGHFTDRRKS